MPDDAHDYSRIPPPQPPAENGPWLGMAVLPAQSPLRRGFDLSGLSQDFKDLLFRDHAEADLSDHPKDSRPTRLFAILDGALIMGLPEILETSGLENDCLFSGETAEQIGDNSPWIVQLTPEAPLVRQLFTSEDFASGYFETEPEIFIRSKATLAEMRAHFRKFTRLRDANGKWVFFAFGRGLWPLIWFSLAIWMP